MTVLSIGGIYRVMSSLLALILEQLGINFGEAKLLTFAKSIL